MTGRIELTGTVNYHHRYAEADDRWVEDHPDGVTRPVRESELIAGTRWPATARLSVQLLLVWAGFSPGGTPICRLIECVWGVR